MTVDLRTDRINRGLSVEAFARQIGVEPHVLRHAEKTGRRPQPENARKIADFYEVAVTEMWPLDDAELAA